ncbi:hypothetical protein D3C76_1719210 [compost metagenome]
MAEQGGSLIGPRSKQAVDTKEAFVMGLLPQLSENRQAGVAAVADDEGRFTRAAGDRRWLIQPSFAD